MRARGSLSRGCHFERSEKSLESLGIPIRHFMTTDYGVEKGKTEITRDLIETTAGTLAREVAGECDCAAG